jgi:preprotein translocase subunit YajC
MLDLLMTPAYAADAPPQTGMFNLLLIGGMFLMFWLLIWRPQAKKAKEHKNLISSLETGDEVLTVGGLMGRVVRQDEQYVVLQVAEGVEMRFQKSSVASTLPKGTFKQT